MVSDTEKETALGLPPCTSAHIITHFLHRALSSWRKIDLLSCFLPAFNPFDLSQQGPLALPASVEKRGRHRAHWRPGSSPAHQSRSGHASGNCPPGTQRMETFRLILNLSALVMFTRERALGETGALRSLSTQPRFAALSQPGSHTHFLS